MAQKKRTKEIWLIPKRSNLHQTICLIDGIIERKYDGTSWNSQKQNNLGVNLKKWGATNKGNNISLQSMRTLIASIPQYLGFLYINTESTPSTICLTKVGTELWFKHKNELVKVPNLIIGKKSLITKSEIVLKQMEKLQITNPVINKDCENIYVFPFRFMLKVLLLVDYIDEEEIAYFLFKARKEDEVNVTVQEINNFRDLSKYNREKLIDAFKDTHIGSITLAKAGSAGYFIGLCLTTGIIDKIRVKPNNRSGSITALKINYSYKDYVKDILSTKYKDIETYDFKNNLKLWIDYIGDPTKEYPPIDVSIINKDNDRLFIQIYKNGECKHNDIIDSGDALTYPMFVNEQYDLEIIDITNGNKIKTIQLYPTLDCREYEINGNSYNDEDDQNGTVGIISDKEFDDKSLGELSNEVIEHCESTNFSKRVLDYLTMLSVLLGMDKTNDKSLRGAYLEYYFYKILCILKEENIIDEVIWNGKVGKYKLPTQAPGGKTGIPDIIFIIDDLHIILELTTIKAKSSQFKAEGSSVPEHIRLYKHNSNFNVAGIFCAPIIHQGNTTVMQSALSQYGINLHCIPIKDLIDLFLTKDRNRIKNYCN